jgi:hypothetical protein
VAWQPLSTNAEATAIAPSGAVDRRVHAASFDRDPRALSMLTTLRGTGCAANLALEMT